MGNYHEAKGLPEVERDKRSEIERVMKPSNSDLWELIEQLFKEFKVPCDIMLLDKVLAVRLKV